MFGYNNKILHVDLSLETHWIEEPGLEFYRKFGGGSGIGTYYCLKEIPKGANPLGPENILAVSASILTGAPIPFLSRFSINGKSPLGGTIGDSQGGGWFGPELKAAGFDAIIIKGIAKSPSYLWIQDGHVEIRSAEAYWGSDTGEVQEQIRLEIGEKSARVLSIGKAGENLVKYACILNEKKHANGRTGMGAVMGSKRLKAIAVKGSGKPELFDRGEVLRLAKESADIVKSDPGIQALSQYGTNDGWAFMNEVGGLPTKNFKDGCFDDFMELTAEAFHELYHKNETCFACPVKCKIALKAEAPYLIDPSYGGPEYETVAAFGSYLAIKDRHAIAKANELCNKYGLDTISAGASIAFAMECFEEGLLATELSEGLDLSFGNDGILVPLIEKIADLSGIGAFIAKGPREMAELVGQGSHKFAMEIKGNPVPAHMARQKNSMAVIYAVNPYGADHCSAMDDYSFMDTMDEEERGFMRSLDLNDFPPFVGITQEKTRMVLYTQHYLSIFDVLGICMFSEYVQNHEKLCKIIQAVTGWQTSLFELMKIGERKVNLMKYFNEKHGIKSAEDRLPERMFDKLDKGATEGIAVDRAEFERAIQDYYDMAGWNYSSGKPGNGKLKELGLNWLVIEDEN